jgi:hypothetical protein
VLLAVAGLDSNLPIYAGLGASLLVYVLVSLGARPPAASAARAAGPARLL